LLKYFNNNYILIVRIIIDFDSLRSTVQTLQFARRGT